MLHSDSQIQAYFNEHTAWSLISFLKYRKEAPDFTKDKAVEHMLYKKALEDIVAKNAENCIYAKECLANFTNEREAPVVEAFWVSDGIDLIKINYAKDALRKTVNETQDIRAIVAEETSAIIKRPFKKNEKKRSIDELEDTVTRRCQFVFSTPIQNNREVINSNIQEDQLLNPFLVYDDGPPKNAESISPVPWEFDYSMPSWLEKMKKQYHMLVSETDQTARPLYWRIVDASDRSVVPDILHEEDFLELNAMFSSALNLGNQESNWTVLDPPAERCLQSLSNLNSNQLCEVAKIVKPEGTRGAILRLQKISDNIKEEAFEPGLFGDDNADDNTPCPCPVQETDYMNPDVQYILDLLRFTKFEMLEKGIPQRKNSERDIDVFIKTHIFSCFDGVLDRHFGDMVSRASRRRRVEAVDAPNKAEGFHVDWLFTKHDLAKDVPWGHEFSLCERAGSKVENDKKVDLHTLRVQKTLRDMHSALFEAIATAGGGALSRSVLHVCTKLLMPGFISSWFFIRVMLVIYVGAGFYSSTKLAEFDMPMTYNEIENIIKIARVMLQTKKIFCVTIRRFKQIIKKAESEKFAKGKTVVRRVKEFRSPMKQ